MGFITLHPPPPPPPRARPPPTLALEVEEEEDELPEDRPDFLSERAWERVRAHFRGDVSYDPAWLRAYAQPAGYMEAHERFYEDSKAARESLAEGGAGHYIPPPPRAASWQRAFNDWVVANQLVANNGYFSALIIFCIVFAGVLVGVQSYPAFTAVEEGGSGEGLPIAVLAVLDTTIQIIFTSECLFKIFAEGVRPLRYWCGPDLGWNNFDFWLVAVCWLPFFPPDMGGNLVGNVAFLRLLRLMRLLKLVGKVKQLQLIVMGLVNGLNAVTYILVLMLLVFYLFAVLGVGSFQENDPTHFGSLGVAMLTLFRCATLEDWSDVMYINFYGCDSEAFQVVGGGGGSHIVALSLHRAPSPICPRRPH